MSKKFDFKIGADPECTILFNGQRVPAHETLESLFGVKSLKGKRGEFGCDGCAATAELRPNPSNDPVEITENLRDCFKRFFEEGSAFDLTTLSLWAPLGGHIHLDCGPNLSDDIQRKLVFLSLPIMRNELITDALIRKESGFGKNPFDFHFEAKQKGRTIELRSPTAQWLTTPQIAKATLATYGVIWHELMKNGDKLPKNINLDKPGVSALFDLLMSNNMSRFIGGDYLKIPDIIKKFERYADFKEDVDYIFNHSRVLADKKKAEFSINQGWGFKKKIPLSKKTLFANPKIKTDTEGPWFAVNHNGDVGTALFAEELKKRILAGVPLKHSYYIFGLRRPKNEKKQGTLVAQGRRLFLTPPLQTANDLEMVNKCVQRIDSKIKVTEKLQIDFKSEKIIRDRSKPFILGLPRDMRDEKDVEAFMEIILKIEQGELKPIPSHAFKDLKKTAKPSSENRDLSEKKVNRDDSSQGRGFAIEALRRLPKELVATSTHLLNPALSTGRAESIANLLCHAPKVSTLSGDVEGALVGIDLVSKEFIIFIEDQDIPNIENLVTVHWEDSPETRPGGMIRKPHPAFYDRFYEDCPNLVAVDYFDVVCAHQTWTLETSIFNGIGIDALTINPHPQSLVCFYNEDVNNPGPTAYRRVGDLSNEIFYDEESIYFDRTFLSLHREQYNDETEDNDVTSIPLPNLANGNAEELLERFVHNWVTF